MAGLTLGLLMLVPLSTAQADVWTSDHVFSIDDVQGGFDGSTFGPDGAIQDPSILCGPGMPSSCPPEVAPITDTKLIGQPVTLYPVDSEFGFLVVDFLGASAKTRDGDYMEGFIGNLPAGNYPGFGSDVLGGVAVSNAATDTYKVKPPMGTWCRGLGGNSVKCETEHYTVMEHVLSCHEVIPYFFADPVTGVQEVLSIPEVGTFDCANAGLDDIAYVMRDGMLSEQLTDSTPCEEEGVPAGCQMFPNDKTDMLNDLALTEDYSIQLKDDGKALYGWGTIHKRPNDIRFYARLGLPDEWKAPGANYYVTNATLTVRHYITNNPNDQLRPEDLENEAAEGRKPAYTIEGTIGEADEVWKSSKSCFEGDGDFIDTEEGAGDPDAIGVGTVFKNMPFAITSSPPISPIDLEPPYPFSSDLREALTNAWYTTVDRDPFEWSYDANPDPYIQDFVGSRAPNPLLGDLVSGPRWRLTANKYGQDLPGLEIAIDAPPGGGTDGADCYAPPFAKELIKYNVGEPIVTVINLLDWDESEGPSPLATTRGWVDIYSNDFVAVDHIAPDGTPISTNGVPMTDDFDLAVYVKGDRKATGVFDATLSVDWDAVSPVLVVVPDVVGLDQATAEADIVAVNLTVGTISTAFDDFVPAGDVISQAPLAGTSVAEFTPVDLLVSLGPDLGLINVPNVVGLDQATAEATIVAANLTVGTITPASSDTVPEGDVISQSPVDCIACATVGDPVDLVVSTGPDVGLIDVPNVVGLSQAAAEAAIVAANLTVGNVTTENSATVPAGDVISQSPTDCVACASVGDPVDLVVSLGPADLSDVSISSIFVPSSVPKSVNRKFDVYIINDINAAGDGTGFVRIIGMDGATEWVTVDLPFSNLQPSTVATLLSTTWTSPSTSTYIDWTVELWVDGSLIETVNASTRVR